MTITIAVDIPIEDICVYSPDIVQWEAQKCLARFIDAGVPPHLIPRILRAVADGLEAAMRTADSSAAEFDCDGGALDGSFEDIDDDDDDDCGTTAGDEALEDRGGRRFARKAGALTDAAIDTALGFEPEPAERLYNDLFRALTADTAFRAAKKCRKEAERAWGRGDHAEELRSLLQLISSLVEVDRLCRSHDGTHGIRTSLLHSDPKDLRDVEGPYQVISLDLELDLDRAINRMLRLLPILQNGREALIWVEQTLRELRNSSWLFERDDKLLRLAFEAAAGRYDLFRSAEAMIQTVPGIRQSDLAVKISSSPWKLGALLTDAQALGVITREKSARSWSVRLTQASPDDVWNAFRSVPGSNF